MAMLREAKQPFWRQGEVLVSVVHIANVQNKAAHDYLETIDKVKGWSIRCDLSGGRILD